MSDLPLNSLADIRAAIASVPGPDETAAAAAAEREPQLTKPPGSLGRLEELSGWLAAWQGRHPPHLEAPAALVFAGNHGVTARGVSAYPAEVTAQMVGNFEAGGAAVNQLCEAFHASLAVTALDLDKPTRDFCDGPAMDEADFAAAFSAGFSQVHGDMDVVCLGEMGIGNTTSAAAICHGLYGGEPADWTGPGSGVEGAQLVSKAGVVGNAVAGHREHLDDGLEVLRRLGGRELAAIAGAVVGARMRRVPVILDGYVSSAAAVPLAKVDPGLLDHCQVGHASAEPGHLKLLEQLGKVPLLQLDMRLGEASGAVLALGVLRGAVHCHAGMATFAEAGVTDKD